MEISGNVGGFILRETLVRPHDFPDFRRGDARFN